jgi:acyl-coenzyme A synthetase/AMP-(fatty) acid ligase/acyl carrier protein
VEITHASLNNLIDWHLSAFSVKETDRASQVASVGFDAAVWEIWPYLTAGASLHFPDEMTRRSWRALQKFIVDEKITVSFVPTPLAEPLMRTPWPSETALRVLLTGGDVLRQRPLGNLPFSVINNYGPTECTVVSTSGVVLPDIRGGVPTIGRPILNVHAFVLDSALRPVRPGDAGELCIGGASVGRGYVRQPELTAQQFVWYASPVGEPTRIYRTGDRVKLLETGEFEFVGRLDDQVKIRGYRIEPEEVAKTLKLFPRVETCTVVAREVGQSGTMLIAYVVACDGAHLSASELGEFLAERLPQYMVPAVFVSIPELPLTANGKVDKATLPSPCDDNLLPNKPATAKILGPTGEIQQAMSDLIASMLGRASISPEENFFMVGGHSMLGVELVARIRDEFGVQLSLRQLFTAPTISALSTVVAVLTQR